MSKIRVDFVAPPFRGHLHPILGLARAVGAVAEVRVLTTAGRLDEVRAAGVEGVGLMDGRDDEIESIVSPPHPVRGHPLRLWRQFRSTLALLDELKVEVETVWRARRPDLVIVDSVLPSVGHAAAGVGASWWTSLASPCALEPRRGAPAYLGGWRHRDDLAGRLRDRAGLALVRGFKRAAFLAQRGTIRRLGIGRLYRSDGDEAAYSPECILGLGMDEIELPRAWPRAFRMVGPVLYTPPRADAVAPALEAGRRHVLVTLGTHLAWVKDAAAERMRRAAAGQDRWVVHFSDGRPAAEGCVQEGGAFRRYSYIDYEKWLGSFDLVVHHGGAGVMYHCLRVARPALVWPQDYDQFDNAVRLERAGVARRLPAGGDVRGAIDEALADEPMREACLRLQAALGRYDAGAAVAAMVGRFRPVRPVLRS